MSIPQFGYAFIQQLKKAQACTVPDLLALAAKNDPFYAGGKASRCQAAWFAALWERFRFPRGVHLRRIHYQVVSPGDVQKPDGTLYANTERDWEFLDEASKQARHLRLVDPTAFVDRRNPQPHLFLHDDALAAPRWHSVFPAWEFPRLRTDLTGEIDWQLPEFQVHGYEYTEARQPFHLEVWVEKGTMDDVLLPLCRRYGVNLVTGIGFMTITSVISLLQRLTQSRKPGRIFYISDFDPAGYAMPTSVARHIEYQLRTGGSAHEVKLMPIALTGEQIARYQLPRIPVKDADRRKAHFEAYHGEGAVELDALEALYPGTLAELVEAHVVQHRDAALPQRLQHARRRATGTLRAAWEARIAPYAARLAALKERVQEVVARYQPQFETLQDELSTELHGFREELEALRQAVEQEIAALTVSLPVSPAPKVKPDTGEWLLDSARDYLEQLKFYKFRKTK
jgi:hypothetical protein